MPISGRVGIVVGFAFMLYRQSVAYAASEYPCGDGGRPNRSTKKCDCPPGGRWRSSKPRRLGAAERAKGVSLGSRERRDRATRPARRVVEVGMGPGLPAQPPTEDQP